MPTVRVCTLMCKNSVLITGISITLTGVGYFYCGRCRPSGIISDFKAIRTCFTCSIVLQCGWPLKLGVILRSIEHLLSSKHVTMGT